MANEKQGRIEEAARMFAGIGSFGYTRGNFTEDEKKGYTQYLNSYGLTKGDYPSFLEILAQHGMDVNDLVLRLGIESDILNLKSHKFPTKKIERKLENGDLVILNDYSDSISSQEGRFVTGINPKTGIWGFVSEKDSKSHRELAGNYIPNYEIVEGGVAYLYLFSKLIILDGKSDAFRVGPGEVSSILLKRALPDYEVYNRGIL